VTGELVRAAILAGLVGCSSPDSSGRLPAATDAGEDAADAATPPGARDSCEPEVPTVCLAFEVENPSGPQDLEQIPIACADPFGICFAYSFDPARFDPGTWAWCCSQ
jgi:hypothetical protein